MTVQTDLSQVFQYDDAGQRIAIEQRFNEAQSLMRQGLTDMIEAGGKFAEIRELLRHNKRGGFDGWIQGQALGRRTVYRLIELHAAFATVPQMTQFEIATTAAYLLASPSVPDEARAAALDRAASGERIGVPAAQAIIGAHKPAPPACASVAQLAQGVRAWMGRQAQSRANQISILKGIQGRTTAGLIAIDDLHAGGDLPGPWRKGDVLLAVSSVLDELRQEPGDTGQAEAGEQAPAAGKESSGQASVARPTANAAPIWGPTTAPLLPVSTPESIPPSAHAFPLTVNGITIVNGDSRRLTDYVAPGTAHLIVTSPPYNVAKDYATHDDNLPAADYWALLRAVFGECYRALVEGGRIAVVVPCGIGRNPWRPLAAQVADILTHQGFTLRGEIIWYKGTTGNRTTWGSWESSSNPALRDCTERVIMAHLGQDTLTLPAPVPADWLPGELFLALTQDLWQVAPESAQRIGHPAPFPLELAERLIRLYGYPGCHVVDPFGGSGTVGVAARALGCRATLVDIDAGYCELATRRCTPDAESMP